MIDTISVLALFLFVYVLFRYCQVQDRQITELQLDLIGLKNKLFEVQAKVIALHGKIEDLENGSNS